MNVFSTFLVKNAGIKLFAVCHGCGALFIWESAKIQDAYNDMANHKHPYYARLISTGIAEFQDEEKM